MGGMSNEATCFYHDLGSENEMKAIDGCLKCLYQQKSHSGLQVSDGVAKIDFEATKITPNNLCLHAFRSIYHLCLSKLYFSKSIEEESFRCPSTETKVYLSVEKVPHKDLKTRFLNFLRQIALFLRIPNDLKETKIKINVTKVEGDCPKGHRVGDEFYFNLGDKEEMCPASTFSLYTFLFGKRGSSSYQCPSHLVSVKYNISEVKNGFSK